MANRRKTIVINKKFQYQQALMSVALAVLLVNGYLIFRMLVPVEGAAPLDSSSLYGIAGVELLLLAAVWYGSLKSSHRIAGPVYVFTREVKKLGQGDFSARIRLRKHDMFTDMAKEMNASFDQLRGRVQALKQAAAELRAAAPGSSEADAALARLCQEIDQMQTEARQ